jgi:hypothetical protein
MPHPLVTNALVRAGASRDMVQYEISRLDDARLFHEKDASGDTVLELLYKIVWKSGQNTWEPLSSLANVMETVTEYLNRKRAAITELFVEARKRYNNALFVESCIPEGFYTTSLHSLFPVLDEIERSALDEGEDVVDEHYHFTSDEDDENICSHSESETSRGLDPSAVLGSGSSWKTSKYIVISDGDAAGEIRVRVRADGVLALVVSELAAHFGYVVDEYLCLFCGTSYPSAR